MATTQAVWGIDVGRCALTAIKLRLGAEGAVEVVAHEYVEHEKILSQPDADRGALIAAALEKFLAHNDISKDTVVVSAPGQHTLARFTKLPPCPTKRIPDIVRYEADQQILYLRHTAGLSFNQIAETLEEPLGTVLARGHRALAKLKKLLGPQQAESQEKSQEQSQAQAQENSQAQTQKQSTRTPRQG